MTQKKLTDMLKTPAIQKGKPLGLSTDEGDSAQSHNRTIAPAQQVKAEGPKRTKRGYALRDDLVKACKQIALDRDSTLYEVMETAIEEYLERQEGEAQPVIAAPAPVAKPTPTPAAPQPPAPGDDLVPLQSFADLHAVNRNKAGELCQQGMIASIKQGTGRAAIVLLDAPGRRDFWVQFHETPGFRSCDLCPHRM